MCLLDLVTLSKYSIDNPIKEICLLKAWGAAILKGPGKNTDVDDVSLHTHIQKYGDFLVYMIHMGFAPISNLAWFSDVQKNEWPAI